MENFKQLWIELVKETLETEGIEVKECILEDLYESDYSCEEAVELVKRAKKFYTDKRSLS